MIASKARQLFRVRNRTTDGAPVRTWWVTGPDDAALVDPDAGQLLAYVWHDGSGKYYPTVAVSAIKAADLVCNDGAQFVSFRAFPRVTVELFRIKADEMAEVQWQVEAVLFW